MSTYLRILVRINENVKMFFKGTNCAICRPRDCHTK